MKTMMIELTEDEECEVRLALRGRVERLWYVRGGEPVGSVARKEWSAQIALVIAAVRKCELAAVNAMLREDRRLGSFAELRGLRAKYLGDGRNGRNGRKGRNGRNEGGPVTLGEFSAMAERAIAVTNNSPDDDLRIVTEHGSADPRTKAVLERIANKLHRAMA